MKQKQSSELFKLKCKYIIICHSVGFNTQIVSGFKLSHIYVYS